MLKGLYTLLPFIQYKIVNNTSAVFYVKRFIYTAAMQNINKISTIYIETHFLHKSREFTIENLLNIIFTYIKADTNQFNRRYRS